MRRTIGSGWIGGGQWHERAALEDRCQQAVAAYVDTEHTALRAFGPDSRLAPIPDEHLIAHFTHSLEPSANEPTPSLEVLDQLPECDQCGPGVLARHAAVLRHRDGRLLSATLCAACHRMRLAARASVLASARLVLLAEASDAVRDQMDARASRQGRPSLWATDPLEPEWIRSYRACGFGGPDALGEMSREILGESVCVSVDADGMVHVTATHRSGAHNYTSEDNYAAPATWTEDQVRHLLRQIFPLAQRTNSYTRLENPLPAAEQRMRRALDSDQLPETLLEDAPGPVRASARLPQGPSLAMHDAQRCARASRDTSLLRRLMTEHPAVTVRGAARRRLDNLGTRADMRRCQTLRPDANFDEGSWMTWRQLAPSWAIGSFATRRWATEAGIRDALFSLDADLEMHWDQGLRSRPASFE